MQGKTSIEMMQDVLTCPLAEKNDYRGNARISHVLFFGKVSQKCNARTSCVLFFGKVSQNCNVRTSCVLFFRKINQKCNARTSCVLFFGKVSQNCNVRTSCVLFFGKVSQNCNVRCTTWYFEFGTVESWFVDWIRRWVKLGGVLPFFFSISSFVLFILTILAFMQIIPIFI